MSAECPTCGGTDPADCDAYCADLRARGVDVMKAKGLARQVFLARRLADKYRAEGDGDSPRLREARDQIASCEREIALIFARSPRRTRCMGCAIFGKDCDAFTCSECGESSDVHLETLDHKSNDADGTPTDPYRPCAACDAAARTERRSRPTLPPPSANFTLALEMTR